MKLVGVLVDYTELVIVTSFVISFSDMKEVETKVRSVCTDGLLWGACK